MNWFSEKFMEDCVAEAPDKTIGRLLRLKSQQQKLGGFRPDLIFNDISGKSVIVEIQQFALDRNHLYKCLEYRDLLALEEGEQPTVVLVCESLPDRYKNIITTHGIELFLLDRKTLIEIAVLHCPNSLRTHLLSVAQVAPNEDSAQKPSTPRRYKWSRYDSLTDILLFTHSEISRCGLKEKFKNDSFRTRILFEARYLLEEQNTYSNLLNPSKWRIDNLINDAKEYSEGKSRSGIRKPKAELYMFITSKGNLSLRWYPKMNHESERHDWLKTPETEPYAYQRPENEILFIKDITYLRTISKDYNSELEAIDSMLLALVWGMIEHIKNQLSRTIDLEIQDHFQLIAEKDPSDSAVGRRHELTSWRIISNEDLLAENGTKGIEDFVRTYHIGIDEVLAALENNCGKSLNNEQHFRVAKQLRLKGHKITATEIKKLFYDLACTKNATYLRLTAFR